MATTTTTVKSEDDIRVQILNSFMTCPHRDTNSLKQIHDEMRQKDPLFYAHLAAWYRKNGDLRDHNEVFTAMLITDPYTDNRKTGIALFQQQATFMKSRVVGFIKGKKVTIREKTGNKKKDKNGKVTKYDEIINKEIKVGIEKPVPTCLKTEVTKYLRWLEADIDRFDAVVLKNAKDLKTLYASKGLQIKPCPRAQQILFDKKYPEGSKLNIFKEISEAKTPEQSAKLIVENKIPFTTAVSLVDKVTPSILAALINNMTSQEVINNIASLEEKGAMDNPDLKAIVQKKLESAKKSNHVSALKSKTAKNTGRVKDEAVLKQLDEVADAQVRKSGSMINAETAIFVDRSGSMESSIEVGKRVAAMISGASSSLPHVIAFDTMAASIKAKDSSLTSWEEAFKPIRAGGGTSIGCALDFLLRLKKSVEQIVIVTDEDELQAPLFVDVYPKYCKEMNVSPHVVVVHIGTGNATLSDGLKRASISHDVYRPEKNDYYSLPSLLKFLSRKTKLDLVYEIMDFPLPMPKEYRMKEILKEEAQVA